MNNIVPVCFFIIGIFAAIFSAILWAAIVVGENLIEDEQKLYIECLESKKENCKELHDYFNKIMGEKDE